MWKNDITGIYSRVSVIFLISQLNNPFTFTDISLQIIQTYKMHHVRFQKLIAMLCLSYLALEFQVPFSFVLKFLFALVPCSCIRLNIIVFVWKHFYLINTGSLTPAWYMSLITSCRRIPADGIPIPWDMESTGPTLYMAYLRK